LAEKLQFPGLLWVGVRFTTQNTNDLSQNLKTKGQSQHRAVELMMMMMMMKILHVKVKNSLTVM
jgi:hypothetical protein